MSIHIFDTFPQGDAAGGIFEECSSKKGGGFAWFIQNLKVHVHVHENGRRKPLK